MAKTLLFFMIIIPSIFLAQGGYINSLQFKVEQQSIVVTYSLKPTQTGQYYQIQAQFSHAGGIYFPKMVTGDYGDRVSGGEEKRFVWNPLLDNIRTLEGEFKLSLQADLYGMINGTKNMIWIEGGTYIFGDQFNEGNEDERPNCKLQINGFFMDDGEITFEEYDAFCMSIKKPLTKDENWGRGKRPVINISWYDAIEYCNWRSTQDGLQLCYNINKFVKDPNNFNNSDRLVWSISFNVSANGYRLPTEAEWEFAARTRDQKIRFGNGRNKADPKEMNFMATPYIDAISNSGTPRQQSVETAQFEPNKLALYDLSGNVQEWCWDWYDPIWYQSIQENNSTNNPIGPNAGLYRTLRGGSWKSSALACRISARQPMRADLFASDIGFRCVRNK